MRIDAIRQQIATWQAQGAINDVEMSALLAPLLYSASFVSNTSGVFKSFHQGWGGRTQTALERIESLLWLTPSRFVRLVIANVRLLKCGVFTTSSKSNEWF